MKQLTLAGLFQANGVFIIQNNGFAISTPREKQTAAKTLAQKLLQQEFLVFVDGMDPLAFTQLQKKHAIGQLLKWSSFN